MSNDKDIRDAFSKIARIIERLPDDEARRRVVRAFAILLDYPDAVGDRPNV